MFNNVSKITAWKSIALFPNFETARPAINQEEIWYGKSKIIDGIKLYYLIESTKCLWSISGTKLYGTVQKTHF